MAEKTSLTFDDYAGSGEKGLLEAATLSSTVLEVKSDKALAKNEVPLDEYRQTAVTRINAFDEYYRRSPGSGMKVIEDGLGNELTFVEKVGDTPFKVEN